MSSMLFFISFFIGFEWVRAYVETEEEAFDFRPTFWSGEVAKIPEKKGWKNYSKSVYESNDEKDSPHSRSHQFIRGSNGRGNGISSVKRRTMERVFLPHVRGIGKNGLGYSLSRRPMGMPFSMTSTRSKTKSTTWTLDINQADSVAWVGLKGIGPAYAKRIMGYRERLGGFFAVDQLKEVYGLDSMWVEANKGHLVVGAGIYKKIALNRVVGNEFRHPYISYAQVKVFLAYRKQHTVLRDFQALEQIKLLDLSMWNRLRPYLSFEP